MRKMPLFAKIFIGMFLGAILGVIAQNSLGAGNPDLKWWVDEVANPVGQIFLRMIFMVVIPLLFSALVLGITELGDVRRIGRIGMRALGMTFLLTGVAVGLALLAVNSMKPGTGIAPAEREKMMAMYADSGKAEKSIEKAKEKTGFGQTLLGFIPENPFEEAAKPKLGGVLAFMVFALLFGIAMTGIEPEKALPLKQFLEGLFAVSLRLIEMAMSLAPIGVFALIFATAATLGFGAIAALGNWVGVVLLVLVIQLFGTYSLALKFIAKKSPVTFFRNVREVIVTAFTTSSSNATLPTALRVGEEKLGIPRSINSFVLTVGATANQNGTALFEGITVLFLAQLFGVQLAVADQLTIVGLCILAGIGTAGVPGGAWPMIASILVMVGVPPEAIGLCIGIDRILDMSRTVVNVVGDLTIAECVAAGEPMELSEAMD
jgi:dicarboxylate/amino acid:cation (Na+ or H+) symporter, DAACS family